MAEIVLTSGATSVTVYEVREELPQEADPMEVLWDETGRAIPYVRSPGFENLHVAGRMTTKADVQVIAAWLELGSAITVTSRNGDTSTGWRVRTDPPPKANVKDGDSADWLIDITLWRIQ